MAITLQLDQTVDGVPPGSQATQFGSGQMMDNVNNWMVNNSGILGLEEAQNRIAHSFVKGLGISGDIRSLDVLFPEVEKARSSELTQNIGKVVDDGMGQYNVSSAGIAAQQMAQDQSKSGPNT